MSSDLFGLISLAGSASLDELRVRSSVEPTALARELAAMLREGTVMLSRNANFAQTDGPAQHDPNYQKLLAVMPGEPNSSQDPSSSLLIQLARSEVDTVSEGIKAALNDHGAALSIMVSPTSRGFKLSF